MGTRQTAHGPSIGERDRGGGAAGSVWGRMGSPRAGGTRVGRPTGHVRGISLHGKHSPQHRRGHSRGRRHDQDEGAGRSSTRIRLVFLRAEVRTLRQGQRTARAGRARRPHGGSDWQVRPGGPDEDRADNHSVLPSRRRLLRRVRNPGDGSTHARGTPGQGGFQARSTSGGPQVPALESNMGVNTALRPQRRLQRRRRGCRRDNDRGVGFAAGSDCLRRGLLNSSRPF
mmetsp:Transcript_51674/g.122418  ORF Transcript_51674/g.122418 Transcript_51674/m.122418 type:complete len:228 (-) Transcript_51674:171-854(-)